MDGYEEIENKPFIRWTIVLISVLLIELFFFLVHSLIILGPQGGYRIGRGIALGGFGFVLLYLEFAGYYQSPRKVTMSKDWFEFQYADKKVKRYGYDHITSFMIHVWDRSTFPGGPTRFGFVAIRKGENAEVWNRQRLNYPAANSLLNRCRGNIAIVDHNSPSSLNTSKGNVVIEKEILRDRYLIGGILFLVIGFALTLPLALIALYLMNVNFQSMYISLWAIVSLAGTIWCFRLDIRGRRRIIVSEGGVKVYISPLQRMVGQRPLIKAGEIQKMLVLVERGFSEHYDDPMETRFYLVLYKKNGKEIFLGERSWGKISKLASELKDRWGIETVI